MQGAPLHLAKTEMLEELEYKHLEGESDLGIEEERENDLRRSSRLERLGRADDNVEDRAIHNAKVWNLEIPKGIPKFSTVLSSSNAELLDFAKQLNASLGVDCIDEHASIDLIKNLEKIRLDIYLQNSKVDVTPVAPDSLPGQQAAVTEQFHELVDTLDELSIDEGEDDLSPRVFNYSAGRKKTGISPECFSVKPVARVRGRK